MSGDRWQLLPWSPSWALKLVLAFLKHYKKIMNGNGQYDVIHKRIDKLSGKIDTLSQEVSDVKEDVAFIKGHLQKKED